MLTYPAPSPINGDGLKAELETAGFIVEDPSLNGSDVLITGPSATEANRSAIGAVVAAHTGTPTAEAQDEADQNGQLAALRTKARSVWNGTDTFTAAQVQKILAGLVLRATK